MDGVKTENSHLREDIKRMQSIVKDIGEQRLTDISGKHFLGKPLKEASMWFSQNLVG